MSEECELVTLQEVIKGRLEITTTHVYFFDCTTTKDDGRDIVVLHKLLFIMLCDVVVLTISIACLLTYYFEILPCKKASKLI